MPVTLFKVLVRGFQSLHATLVSPPLLSHRKRRAGSFLVSVIHTNCQATCHDTSIRDDMPVSRAGLPSKGCTLVTSVVHECAGL